jgi:hypothetical protein
MTCYAKTNSFHFVKIDNHNIKSDVSEKLLLENGGESDKKKSGPNDLPNNLFKYFTRTWNHPV